MKVWLVPLFIISLLAIPGIGAASTLVSQEAYTGLADWGSSSGQSFMLPAGATVRSIQLHIAARGGSVRINLWRTTRAGGSLTRLGATPVGTGVLEKATVLGHTPGWFAIILDTSYTNASASPEEMVFQLELITGGAQGWNDYSFSNLNPYAGGTYVNWGGSAYGSQASYDMTFRILDSTELSGAALSGLTLIVSPSNPSSGTIKLATSATDSIYTVYWSTDLDLPRSEWASTFAIRNGTGGPLTWTVSTSSISTRFFFIEKSPKP